MRRQKSRHHSHLTATTNSHTIAQPNMCSPSSVCAPVCVLVCVRKHGVNRIIAIKYKRHPRSSFRWLCPSISLNAFGLSYFYGSLAGFPAFSHPISPALNCCLFICPFGSCCLWQAACFPCHHLMLSSLTSHCDVIWEICLQLPFWLSFCFRGEKWVEMPGSYLALVMEIY